MIYDMEKTKMDNENILLWEKAAGELKEGLEHYGIALSEDQLHQFMIYYQNLISWNKVMNLTAITEISDVIHKHFLDSLSITEVFPPETLHNGGKLIDVGTGAGFPGIPLAIVFPELEITLLDSLQKRVNFLNDTIEKTGLTNITAIHSRAEEAGRNKKYREIYDYTVSRAVANLSVLTEYCLPFTKQGGYFIAYKSGNAEEEIREAGKAIKLLGGALNTQKKFNLFGTDQERILAVIRKENKTPSKYPRKAGTPSKEPLK